MVQEAERVMDTFKNHLHLPVTMIDHTEVMLARLKVRAALSAHPANLSPSSCKQGIYLIVSGVLTTCAGAERPRGEAQGNRRRVHQRVPELC